MLKVIQCQKVGLISNAERQVVYIALEVSFNLVRSMNLRFIILTYSATNLSNLYLANICTRSF